MLKISVFLQHKERLKERETDREQNMETGWIRQHEEETEGEEEDTETENESVVASV